MGYSVNFHEPIGTCIMDSNAKIIYVSWIFHVGTRIIYLEHVQGFEQQVAFYQTFDVANTHIYGKVHLMT
jgi:hypothetical protein